MKALIWAAVSTRRQNEEDKFSLPQQESDARELSAKEQWDVIDVLRVPGHTRSAYTEFYKLAAAANRKGIDAFLKLEQHWEARDFDVLVIRDGDRLARAQGVMGTIVESVIYSGARIYCFADGWVDRSNFRMWIAMVGYRAASDVDKLRKFFDDGANKRASRGLPVGSSPLWSHKIIRGENGRALYQIPDPDKSLFFQDAAQLILEGVSWYTLEEELFKRFGHGTSEGKPYPPRKVYSILYNPSAWGHEGRFFRDVRRKSQLKGAWAFDESVEPPKGVVMFYNVHKPIYEGDLARRIQEEMRRREVIVRGAVRAAKAHRFTGLIICGECGCNLVHQEQHTTRRDYLRLYCYTKHRKLSYATCTQSKGLNESYIFEFVNAKLEEAIRTRDLATFLGKSPEPIPDTVATIEAHIKTLKEQAGRLIRKQSSAHEDLSDTYDEQLEAIGQQLASARQRLVATHRPSTSSQQWKAQAKTLTEIAEMTLPKFWAQTDNVINQKLHAVMGKRRWVALDGKIVDQVDAPPRRRH